MFFFIIFFWRGRGGRSGGYDTFNMMNISLISSWASRLAAQKLENQEKNNWPIASRAGLVANIMWPEQYSNSYWAASWQNQQNDCAPSEDTDQPGHLPSLIRVFAVRMKKAWVLSYSLSPQWRLCSDWVDAQADLSLHWAHSHFVVFDTRRLILVRSWTPQSTWDQTPNYSTKGAGLVWYDFCFTALQHILGHFGRGQLT